MITQRKHLHCINNHLNFNMCDCIKINYIPIGQEPISIEVKSSGVENSRNTYEFLDDFIIECSGVNW